MFEGFAQSGGLSPEEEVGSAGQVGKKGPLRKSRPPGDPLEAMEWLRRNAEVTPTSAGYLSAASIKSSAKKLGLIVELPDCLIASIAMRLGLPMVTGNTSDYESIRRTGVALVLQNWRED